jgi:hypothetical protein
MTLCDTWERVVQAIMREQGTRTALKVMIYPCAPLHVLDLPQPMQAVHAPQVRSDIVA